MKSLAKIRDQKGFWKVDVNRKKSDPFPGKYPTRWRIQFWSRTDLNKPIWEYIGKPNKLIALKALAMQLHQRGTISCDEFDKGGTFRQAMAACPRNIVVVNTYHGALIYLYYPNINAVAGFFDPWIQPIYHVKAIIGKRVFFHYSRLSELIEEANISNAREFRTWLRKANPFK